MVHTAEPDLNVTRGERFLVFSPSTRFPSNCSCGTSCVLWSSQHRRTDRSTTDHCIPLQAIEGHATRNKNRCQCDDASECLCAPPVDTQGQFISPAKGGGSAAKNFRRDFPRAQSEMFDQQGRGGGEELRVRDQAQSKTFFSFVVRFWVLLKCFWGSHPTTEKTGRSVKAFCPGKTVCQHRFLRLPTPAGSSSGEQCAEG